MRINRVAFWALLAGLVAGTAPAQDQPYGGPPPPPNPYDQNWRQPADPYARQPYGDYDRDEGPSVDVGFFYNELSPYGEWVRHPYYGWVWFPRYVRPDWRPYSLGRWVQSDYGWMWVSYEPFGWATYHYGRWAWDSYLGWVWIPGTEWGPAWVAWQAGNGYIGWAPLPPTVGFDLDVGIRIGGLSIGFGIAPRSYAFVEERRFLDDRVDDYLEPQARNITIINHTTNLTNYTVVDNRVINRGVPVERIEQVSGRRAQRLRVTAVSDPRSSGVQRDTVTIYKPPATRLETVRVGRRNNAGLAPAPQREVQPIGPGPETAPSGSQPAPVAIPVAPRAKPTRPGADEREHRREQIELRESQEKEQRALDQIHRRETAQAQARKADAEEIAKRHAAELRALQEERQREAQQLRIRQQIERQAAQATAEKDKKPGKPPGKPGKPDKPKHEKPGEDQKPPPAD